MNFIKRISFILLFISIGSRLVAQDYSRPESKENQGGTSLNLGVGLGIDYGGIGLKLNVVPDRHIALFVGGGYNLNDFGFNFGISHRVNPENRGCFYYSLMYGYNAVLIVENASQYNKTYYGPSIAVGVELHSRKRPTNFWNFELIVPIRSQEFHDDMNSPNIVLESEPSPVAFSVGYHFSLD